MKVQHLILIPMLLLGGAFVWWAYQPRNPVPTSTFRLPGRIAEIKGNLSTWNKPETSWVHKAGNSETHNQDMSRLWNEVRLQRIWGADEGNFIAYCLSDQPTFTGSDWTSANLIENERVQKLMNASVIFSEHLLIGGEIDNSRLAEIKAILIASLDSRVSYVRAAAVVALAESDYLGDAKLQAQVEALSNDQDTYLSSVVKTQVENRYNRLRGVR